MGGLHRERQAEGQVCLRTSGKACRGSQERVVQSAAPESGAGRLAHAIQCAHLRRGIDPAASMRHWPEQAVLRAIEHASVPHIEGIGILRMTHRAHTDNTSAWWHQMKTECEEALFFYRRVARELGIQVPDFAEVVESNVSAA